MHLYLTENVQYGKIFPLMQVAYVGDTVKIHCQSQTLPKFTLNHFPVKFEHVVKENQLILFNVQHKHSGTYVCKGIHGDKVYFLKTSDLYVGGV